MIRTCHAYNGIALLIKRYVPNSVIKGQRVDELFGPISDVTEIKTNDAPLLRQWRGHLGLYG